MKTLYTFLLVLGLCFASTAQTSPDCSNLMVENMQMDNDTADLMKITLSNNCSNCASGLAGCVYMQLEVIRTVAPFDTVASSKCWCLWSPNNNSQKTYAIKSKTTVMPPLNTFRVSFYGGSNCTCDSIPFRITGISRKEQPASYSIYPNPAKNNLFVKNAQEKALDIRMHDALGRLVYAGSVSSSSASIDLSELHSGLYIVSIQDREAQELRTFRLTKE